MAILKLIGHFTLFTLLKILIKIQSQEIDDDDLLAELEELEQEELDSEMLNIPSSSQEPSLNLPAAPTKTPAAPAAQAVDDELADLEQWMAN